MTDTTPAAIDALCERMDEGLLAHPTVFQEARATLTAQQSELAAVTAREAAMREALEWLDGQHRLSIDYYSPWYGDDDDQSTEWRVSKESGSINDREWDIVGTGQTVLEAINAARAALAGKAGA